LWCVLALTAGCSSDPAGVYAGTYADGSTETIIIRPDGSYEQTLLRDSQVAYINKGTWSLKDSTLEFCDFISAFVSPRCAGGKTQYVTSSSISWGWPESNLLVFSESDNYVLRLTTKEVPPPLEIDQATLGQYRDKFTLKGGAGYPIPFKPTN
jgi:hypothetical protein